MSSSFTMEELWTLGTHTTGLGAAEEVEEVWRDSSRTAESIQSIFIALCTYDHFEYSDVQCAFVVPSCILSVLHSHLVVFSPLVSRGRFRLCGNFFVS